MVELYKVTFLKQSENVKRAENEILDMIDEAYRRGKKITQPDIEKILTSKKYNFSHAFVCKKLKEMQKAKIVRCWQENGVNHFDLPPLIPEPFKLAIFVATIIILVSTMIDVASFGLTGHQYTSMLEGAGESVGTQIEGFQFYAVKCGLFIIIGVFIVTFLQYFFGMFKESKTKRYLNNGS